MKRSPVEGWVFDVYIPDFSSWISLDTKTVATRVQQVCILGKRLRWGTPQYLWFPIQTDSDDKYFCPVWNLFINPLAPIQVQPNSIRSRTFDLDPQNVIKIQKFVYEYLVWILSHSRPSPRWSYSINRFRDDERDKTRFTLKERPVILMHSGIWVYVTTRGGSYDFIERRPRLLIRDRAGQIGWSIHTIPSQSLIAGPLARINDFHLDKQEVIDFITSRLRATLAIR